jgi:toxin ParE1/3/4
VKLRIDFKESARKELQLAACWYEAQRKGLGRRFSKSVNTQLRQILSNPLQWGEIADCVRESPIPSFASYTIIYEIHDDHIYVLSVFHTSRERQDW